MIDGFVKHYQWLPRKSWRKWLTNDAIFLRANCWQFLFNQSTHRLLFKCVKQPTLLLLMIGKNNLLIAISFSDWLPSHFQFHLSLTWVTWLQVLSFVALNIENCKVTGIIWSVISIWSRNTLFCAFWSQLLFANHLFILKIDVGNRVSYKNKHNQRSKTVIKFN